MSIYIYLGPGLRFSRLKSAHARHFVCTVAINFLDIEYVGVNLLSRFIFSKVYRNIPKPIELEIRWNRSMESFDGILHFLFSLLPNFQTVDSERQRVNPISFIVRSFGIKKEKLEDRRKYRRLKFLIIERSSLPLPRFEKEF